MKHGKELDVDRDRIYDYVTMYIETNTKKEFMSLVKDRYDSIYEGEAEFTWEALDQFEYVKLKHAVRGMMRNPD